MQVFGFAIITMSIVLWQFSHDVLKSSKSEQSDTSNPAADETKEYVLVLKSSK